jgi:hypothetical protein
LKTSIDNHPDNAKDVPDNAKDVSDNVPDISKDVTQNIMSPSGTYSELSLPMGSDNLI